MGRPRIYTLDENYFDNIDTPNKAYIIGFLYADGSINLKRNLLTICISEKDREILEFIKKELNYSGIISSKKIKENSYLSLNIISKKLILKLQSIGVIQNKTYESKSLPNIPDNLFYDMLRGIFDGDGSIYGDFNKGYTVCFSSNIYILRIIKEILLNNNIKTSNVRLRNKNSEYSAMLEMRSNVSIEKFKILIYNDNFYLKRKYSKFLEFEKYIKTLLKRNIDINKIELIKKLYQEGKTQKEIHINLGIAYSSVRTVIQRLRKNKNII